MDSDGAIEEICGSDPSASEEEEEDLWPNTGRDGSELADDSNFEDDIIELTDDDIIELTDDDFDDSSDEDLVWTPTEGNIYQRLFNNREPTQAQREELHAYIQVLRQSDQTDHQDEYPGSSRRSRSLAKNNKPTPSSRNVACCVLKSTKGDVIKEALGGEGGEGERDTEFIGSFFSHFQVADALLCDCYDGIHDELVVLSRNRTIKLYSLPRDSPSCVATKEAELSLGVEPYTMARSSDGSFIAVGGECQIFLLTYNRAKKELKYAKIIVFHNNTRSGDWPMANSVRFGKLGSRERLLATNQNGNVYVFEIPTIAEIEMCTEGEEKRDTSSLFMCSTLYDNSWSPSSSEVTLDRQMQSKEIYLASVATWQEAVENCAQMDISRLLPSIANQTCLTNVIGQFPIALNCAVPSPDSKWIAVVGDSQMVFICPVDKVIEGRVKKYTTRTDETNSVFIPFVIQLRLPNVEANTTANTTHRPYSQYCNWNSTSTLVAASSDNARYVAVWQVGTWSLIRVFDNSPRPCLALSFVEGQENTLVWAEDISVSLNIGNVNISNAKKARASLKLPERINKKKRKHFTQTMNREFVDGQRITGIASSKGFVYVATTELISRHQVITEWQPELHKKFMKRFREATKQVLLGAAGNATHEKHLSLLPEPLLLKILAFAAYPVENWIEKDKSSSSS
jgi:hypothetical protein